MEKTSLMTVKEYADSIGVSSQFIYSQIKKGKLLKTVIDGKTFIDASVELNIDHAQPKVNQLNQPIDNNFVEWLKEEVERLNLRIVTLEGQLFDCKSESLNKIVDIQEKKDAQLQQYIEFLNNSTQQLIASAIKKEPIEEEIIKDEPAHHEAEIIEDEPEPVELNSYLKEKKFKKDYRNKVKEDARKLLLKDSRRFTIIDKKIYIYPDTHNYSDLF